MTKIKCTFKKNIKAWKTITVINDHQNPFNDRRMLDLENKFNKCCFDISKSKETSVNKLKSKITKSKSNSSNFLN